MTEKSFQEAKKLMQSANWIRGQITNAKGNVCKWSRINDIHATPKTKESLDKAILRLKEWRNKFASLKFPNSDIPNEIEKKPCSGCNENCYNWQMGDCK